MARLWLSWARQFSGSTEVAMGSPVSTLVLIPGLLSDSTVWQPLLNQIANQAATVADLSTQDNLTQMALDCLNLHDGPLSVAGHSMGARVAMEMARLAPDKIQRLVLLDTGIHPLREGEIEKREEIVQFAYESGMQALAERWLEGMVHAPNRQNSSLMQSLTEMVLRSDPAMHARQIKALTERPNASSYLAEISCPVLLVVGRYDQWSPVSQHEDMLQLLPNARLEIIENAGHFAPVEQADGVAQLVSEFLLSPRA